jgi:hypothetical protein
MLTDLRDKSDGSLNIFYQETPSREINIIKQVDKLNRLNGRDTVDQHNKGLVLTGV